MSTSPEDPSTPCILVVEDDEDARTVLKEILEERGFAVADAANGRVALDLMVQEPAPSLVILDLDMPIMSGGELLGVMRRDERLASVPVLILSGSSKHELPRREGVVGVLSKPCDVERLVATVKRHVASELVD